MPLFVGSGYLTDQKEMQTDPSQNFVCWLELDFRLIRSHACEHWGMGTPKSQLASGSSRIQYDKQTKKVK